MAPLNPVWSKVMKVAGWVLVAIVALYGAANVIVLEATKSGIGLPMWAPIVVGVLAGIVKLTRIFVATLQGPKASESSAAVLIVLAGLLGALPQTPVPTSAPASPDVIETAPAPAAAPTPAPTTPAEAVPPADGAIPDAVAPVSMRDEAGNLAFAVAEGLLNFGCSGAQQAGWMAFGASTAMCIAQECKVADDVTLALQHGVSATMGVSMAACVASCAGRAGLAVLTKDVAVQPKSFGSEKLVDVSFPRL